MTKEAAGTSRTSPLASKSRRGVAASLAFLLAVPVTALSQLVAPGGAGLVIHLMLGMGAILMALAIPDFRTPRWLNRVGAAAIGALAAIFLLQAAADALRHPSMTRIAYGVLGQGLEGGLADAFVAWCVAVILLDSGGWRRAMGVAVTAAVIVMRVYARLLAARGSSINVEAPGLQAIPLLLFVWLLLESVQRRAES